MKRREVMLNSAVIAGAAMTANTVFAADAKGTGKKLGDQIIPPEQEMGKEKHVPIVHAPDSVSAGKAFRVRVVVGETVPHPNTLEHHIAWIALYQQPEGSRYVFEVAKIQLGATFAQPTLEVDMMLEKNATLFAVEHCNIHGLWDYSVDVKVS